MVWSVDRTAMAMALPLSWLFYHDHDDVAQCSASDIVFL
jgi:hypothetical protein